MQMDVFLTALRGDTRTGVRLPSTFWAAVRGAAIRHGAPDVDLFTPGNCRDFLRSLKQAMDTTPAPDQPASPTTCAGREPATMKVAELRACAKQLGMSDRGGKADVLERVTSLLGRHSAAAQGRAPRPDASRDILTQASLHPGLLDLVVELFASGEKCNGVRVERVTALRL